MNGFRAVGRQHHGGAIVEVDDAGFGSVVVGRAAVRHRSVPVDPETRRSWVRRLAPVGVWLVTMAVAATSLFFGVRADRERLIDGFRLRTAAAADLLSDYIEDRQLLLGGRAAELLAEPQPSVRSLTTVVEGLGMTIGAVFDSSGRLIIGLPPKPEFVGRDFTRDLEHVRVAVQEDRPAVTQAVISPALGTPVVGIAVPYGTPMGRRIVTGVFALEGGTFGQLLRQVADLDTTHAAIVDRSGHVIAASPESLPATLTTFSALHPGLAEAVAESPSGRVGGTNERPHEFASVPVTDTGWQLVVSIDHGTLFSPVTSTHRLAAASIVLLGVIGLGGSALVVTHDLRRRLAEGHLRSLNGELHSIVEQRTADLAASNAELAATVEAMQRAQHNVRHLAAIVDAAGDAIIGEDVEGFITSWNPAAQQLYGYTAAEILGAHVTRLAEPDSHAGVESLLARAVAGEQIVGAEARRITKSGEVRFVSLSLSPIFDASGCVVGVAGIHRDLTGQRDVERREQQAQALFASVFESGGAPQGVSDLTGRLVRVNDALCAMLGYERDELLDMTVEDITSPVDRDATGAYLRRMLAGDVDRTHQVVKSYRHRDGHDVVALATLTVVDDPDGGPAFVVAMLHDITERARDQERLAQREALLNGMTSYSANISIMWDLTGRCVFAAGAGFEALGLRPEDLVGHHLSAGEDDVPDIVAAFRRAAEGEPVDVMTTFRGRTYDARLRAVRRNGNITHVAAVATDITEAQQARWRLEASEQRFRALVQNAREVIIQVAGDGAISYISPAISEIVGIGPDELEGRKVFEFIVDEDRDVAAAHLAAVNEPGAVATGRCRVRHVNGEIRDVEYRVVNLLTDPAVGTLVANLRDVTERTGLEAEQEAYAAELAQINSRLREALETREHILAATTHELRTPLTPLIGMLEIIRRRWDELTGAQLRDYLDLVERNAVRLGRLVEDLLLVTRARTGSVPISPAAVLLDEHLSQALRLWPDTADVQTRGTRGLQAWCTPDHLDQILTNLVSNAVKYGAPPYEVRVDSDPISGVTVTIQDHGAGVPADLVDRLFEPFVQGSVGDTRTATGLGLGLSIARTLAQANGGSLTHRPAPGAGATFLLTLPLPPAADGPEPEADT